MLARKVIIVDDEPAARQQLCESIARFAQLQLVAEFSDGHSAIEGINRLKPDIVFLDIEMPETDGFAVAKATQKIPFHLVFVTAFEQYALDAFDTRAIGYLLKPAHPRLIERTIDKILQQESLQQLHSPAQSSPSITLAEDNTVRVLDLAHISLIEGIGRYRRIHLSADGQKIHRVETLLSAKTLNDFEQMLPKDRFIRTHRSYLVQLGHIFRMYSQARRHYLVIQGQTTPTPIARSQVAVLKTRLGE